MYYYNMNCFITLFIIIICIILNYYELIDLFQKIILNV